MSRKNKTKYIVLGLLTIRPMSGYDIKQAIMRTTSNFWNESDGQLYPTLSKLLKDGCVSCDATQCVGARPRKVYQINAKGLQELQEWLPEPAAQDIGRSEFLLKLFFGKNVAPDISIEQVNLKYKQTKEHLEYLNGMAEHIEEDHADMIEQPYWQLTIKYGQYLAQAELDWCLEALKVLKQIKQQEGIK